MTSLWRADSTAVSVKLCEGEIARATVQMAIAEAQVLAVRDELGVKTADFERIKMQLEQKRIKSPINGTVTHVYKDVGEFVSASEPVVLKVVQLDPLLVVFSVPASEARDLKVNQEVPLAVGNERSHVNGMIEFVSPTADAQSGTARVKIRIPNSNGRFQSGDGCWLQMAGREESNANLGAATRYTSNRN